MAVDVGSCFWRSVPIVVKNHDHELMSALHKQQRSGNLCDVWLVIENEKLSAHKAVLASFSSYFQTLFENGLQTDTARSKACNVKEIHLSSVKKSTFLPILHFIYTSRLHLFKENIGDILRTSRKLQIASIVEICEKMIEEQVVLPSLNEANQVNPDVEAEADRKAKSNILYVDLSNGDDEEDSTRTNEADLKTLEKPNISPEVESSRQLGKSLLGFENLPETHSNGWPMRSSETSVRVSASSSVSGEVNAEQLQVDSVYSISSSSRQTGSSEVILTQAPSNGTSTNASYKYGRKAMNIPRKNDTRLECSYCGKYFSKKTNLKRHILIKHSTNHRFSCPRCEKRYAIEQSLRYHLATVHGIVSNVSAGNQILTDSAISVLMQSTQPSSSIQASSSSQTSILSSLTSPNMSTVDGQRVTSSVPETSLGQSFLAHSMVPSTVEDVISLTVPTTTLFPSIANLGDPQDLDKVETNVCSETDSLYKLYRDSYQFSHSSPVQEQNENSDDDMPTISRVESIREPFTEADNPAFDQSSISIESGTREAIEVTSDILVKVDPDRKEDNMDVLEEDGSVSSPEKTSTSLGDNSRPDSTTTSVVTQMVPLTHTPGTELSPARISSGHPLLNRTLSRDSQVERQQTLPAQSTTVVTTQLLESPITGILNLANSSNNSRLQYIQQRNALPTLITTQAAQNSVQGPLNLVGIPMCGICGKMFQTQDQLICHRRKCSKCPFCHRIFSQYSNMKRHIDVFHSTHKPHKCHVCGRAYGIKQSMRLHMQTKHGIPYVTRKYNRNQKVNQA